MQVARREKLYSYTSRENAPTLRVTPGEVFAAETELCTGGWLSSLSDRYEPGKQTAGNPSSGAIYVEGARPGRVLAVELLSLEPEELGYTAHNSRFPPFGRLKDKEWGLVTRTVLIRDGFIHWNDQLQLPVQPMLGYLGVAPERESFSNSRNGPYGGNLDAQEVAAGATVYLPIFVEGALLHLGDMHAIQGDGEICGAGGVETRGRVTLRCSLLPRPERMGWPRIEGADYIATVATARPAESAFWVVVEELLYWLADGYGLPEKEAFLLLGQVLEARVTQFVNPAYTYLARVQKKYLPPALGWRP